MTPRAVVYCRVSTKEQISNYSLTNQERACREYCQRKGIVVDRIFRDEGASAKTRDRPELMAMLEYCRKSKGGIDYVVVSRLDRFARQQHDHVILRALLRGYGVGLMSATEPLKDDPVGKLMENMLASFAQFDNDVKGERTKTGMQEALQAGRWVFQAPLGYRNCVDGAHRRNIEPDPERAPLIREAFEAYATGLYRQGQVLRKVSRKGLRTRNGRRLSPGTFGDMLRNPIYAGLMRVEGWGDPVRGMFKPIVSQETFDRVQAILGGRRVTVTPHVKNHPDFPLRAFVKCGNCQRPLTGSKSRGGEEHTRTIIARGVQAMAGSQFPRKSSSAGSWSS